MSTSPYPYVQLRIHCVACETYDVLLAAEPESVESCFSCGRDGVAVTARCQGTRPQPVMYGVQKREMHVDWLRGKADETNLPGKGRRNGKSTGRPRKHPPRVRKQKPPAVIAFVAQEILDVQLVNVEFDVVEKAMPPVASCGMAATVQPVPVLPPPVMRIAYPEKATKWGAVSERVRALAIDEYFDLLDYPNDNKSIVKMRGGIMSNKAGRLVKFKIHGLLTGGVRIIRTGNWASAWAGIEGYETKTPHQPPKCVAAWVQSIRPGMFYLGFLPCRSLHRNDVQTVECSTPGCPHPRSGDSEFCRQHELFFEYGMTLHDRNLDPEDFFSPWNPNGSYSLVNDVRPPNIYALERSLRFMGPRGYFDERHRSSTEAPQDNTATKKCRRHFSWHDKRERQRAALEREADRLLGITSPADQECDFIPPDERDGDEVYEKVEVGLFHE